MYNSTDALNLRAEEILVYLRKSRSDDPLLTVEEVLQKHETILNEWAEKHLDAKIPDNNRFREVVSGETIADRPEMQKVLRLIESPKIKAILIVEVQRLSRGDLEDAGRLIKLLRFTNTLVITPQKIYNLSDEYDRDFFERELKRGNEFLEYQKKIMQRGTLLSVSQGNYVGSIPPYGYDKAWITEGKRKCPTLTPNKTEANVVYTTFELFCNKGYGLSEICKHFDNIGVKPPKGEYWLPDTIRTILTNPHYIGKVKWNWRKTVTVVEDSEILKTRPKAREDDCLLFDGKHKPIVPEETFNEAQKKLGKCPRKKSATKIRNPFASLLFCQCGKAMTYRTHKKNGVERCAPRLLCNNQTHCGTTSCSYDELLYTVKITMQNAVNGFETMLKSTPTELIAFQEQQIETLENKLKELETREIMQWEAQTDPDPTKRMPPEIFTKLNEKLQREKAEATQALNTARQTLPTHKKTADALIRFREAMIALDDEQITAETKNLLLKNCIEKITYTREKSTRRNQRDTPKQNNGWSSSPIILDITFKI